MKRKSLALFVSLAMLLSLLTVGLVFAEDAQEEAPAEEVIEEITEETVEQPEETVEPAEEGTEVPEGPAEEVPGEETVEQPEAPAEGEETEAPAEEQPTAPAEDGNEQVGGNGEAEEAPAAPANDCTCGAAEGEAHDVDCPVFLATISKGNAVKHCALYVRAMKCESFEELLDVLETAEYEAVMELSTAEIDEINEFMATFTNSGSEEPELPEGTYCEDEIVESEIVVVTDTVSETAVAAPFLPPVKGE